MLLTSAIVYFQLQDGLVEAWSRPGCCILSLRDTAALNLTKWKAICQRTLQNRVPAEQKWISAPLHLTFPPKLKAVSCDTGWEVSEIILSFPFSFFQFPYFLSVLPSFLLSSLLSILSFYFIPSISLSIMQTFFLPFLSSLLPRFSVLSISLSSYSSSFPCFCLSFLFSTLPHLFICFSFPPFLLFHSFGISQWNLLSLSPCLHFISLFWSHRSEVNHLQTNSISQSQISRCCCQNSSASNKTHTQDETDLNQQKIYVHSCKSVNQVADKASPHLINAVYWTEIHFFQLWLHFSRFLLAILGTSFEQLTVKVCLWIQVQQFVIEKHPLNCLLCMFETRIHSMIINHLFAGVKRIEKIREMQKVHVGLVYAFVCMS